MGKTDKPQERNCRYSKWHKKKKTKRKVISTKQVLKLNTAIEQQKLRGKNENKPNSTQWCILLKKNEKKAITIEMTQFGWRTTLCVTWQLQLK